MEWLMFFALSAVAAIIFNFAYPKVLASPNSATLQGSYFGKTLLTAGAFFVVLLVAAWLMSAVGEHAEIPTA